MNGIRVRITLLVLTVILLCLGFSLKYFWGTGTGNVSGGVFQANASSVSNKSYIIYGDCLDPKNQKEIESAVADARKLSAEHPELAKCIDVSIDNKTLHESIEVVQGIVGNTLKIRIVGDSFEPVKYFDVKGMELGILLKWLAYYSKADLTFSHDIILFSPKSSSGVQPVSNRP